MPALHPQINRTQLALFALPPAAKRRSRLERDRERVRSAGKRCSGRCGRWRPWHDFHARRALPDGHQSRCKYCSREAKNPKRRSSQEEQKKTCSCCMSLAHRRPPRGCTRCGEPYRPLEAEIAERQAQIRSGFGQGVGFNYPNNDGV
jgi:hypothetical protein